MSSQRGNFGYVDPDFPPPTGQWDTPVIIYGYTPSFALAVLATALFLLLLLVHTFQLSRHRSWYFSTFPVGLLFEIVGYAARALSARKNPYNLVYFILNYFFIVTGPVFLAAGIYAVLSALIHRLGRHHSPVPPNFVLGFFVASDVVATITQISGAALIGVRQSRREDPAAANNILLGGLAYQVFSIGCFVAATGWFLFRARRRVREHGLTAFVAAFAAATLLVYLRTCFRLAETAEGLGGHLYSNEVFFGVLEFAPVVLAVILFAVWHPGRCVAKKVSGDLGDVEKARVRSDEHVKR
ncbi:Sphingoid long-chain base transporter RSB1 [Colletotrichum orbiculare MAFF 240422]|uniref:Sphingoid long-chain base transporter RSB1 n=1 Tax=Colletotrichum orbiculare (strain 104-T / ATCC 96160 / CBS 514.97 / LARS 414 / MAFF 240422) TaxID=1213857 RepID=N4V4Z5_COLOR|nr:Sphingoid long-chain base transporter RSB1 [Colletotrichum orbiculare MAFF 240422]